MNQFWVEVSQAYNKVSADHSLEMTVARDGNEAKIRAVPFTEDEVAVAIIITPKETATKQAFIVPGGT